MAVKGQKRFFAVTLLSATVALIVMVICTVVNIQRIIDNYDDSVLSTINITLTDGVSLEDLNNSEKKIEYLNNQLTLTKGESEQVFNGVNIRGRGNISWFADKKPYRIKFEKKEKFLNLGEHKKWAFLTYDLDDSLLRGDLGYYLARIINEDYPLRGEFANLIINDNELGLYYISPTIDIDKNLVDLRDEMGVLVELDNAWYSREQYYQTEKGSCLVAKDVVIEENRETALKMFGKAFEQFEDAVLNNDFDMIKNVVDVESLAEYYLFSEFSQNYDAYLTSFYMYKDGYDDKIHFGPVWDFDGIAGNKNWREDRNDKAISPTAVITEIGQNSQSNERCQYDKANPSVGMQCVVRNLARMPDFQTAAKKKYMEKLHGKGKETISYLKKRADYIREAAIRNNEIWDHGSFDDEVEYLVWWLDKRFDYFDEIYGEKNVNFKIQREI